MAALHTLRGGVSSRSEPGGNPARSEKRSLAEPHRVCRSTQRSGHADSGIKSRRGGQEKPLLVLKVPTAYLASRPSAPQRHTRPMNWAPCRLLVIPSAKVTGRGRLRRDSSHAGKRADAEVLDDDDIPHGVRPAGGRCAARRDLALRKRSWSPCTRRGGGHGVAAASSSCRPASHLVLPPLAPLEREDAGDRDDGDASAVSWRIPLILVIPRR